MGENEKKFDTKEVLGVEAVLVEDFSAFDEMNIIEIPFCTLQQKTSQQTRIDLSPDGEEYLQTNDQGYGLPTAHAETVLLGLLWMTMEKNKFQSPKIRVHLRELVEKYMNPGRFTEYQANGGLLASTEKELHRIASTRIHSNRWWDNNLKKRVPIDAAIIDYISVVQEGGGSAPRILEIGWGNKIYESVRTKYTKGLDVQKWLKIKRPIARRLYRWLDRQLAEKSEQAVKSCINWAKFKMLIQHSKVLKGGRTASSYIFSKVEAAIKELNDLDFAVRLTVDKSKPDFKFTFQKIPGTKNEVVSNDYAGELVFDFRNLFHGVKRKRHISDKERAKAQEWIDQYGYKKARWMLTHCRLLYENRKKMLEAQNKTTEPPYKFAGLGLYEARAEGDYEKDLQKRIKQEKKELQEQLDEELRKYKEARLKEFHKQLPDEERWRIAHIAKEVANKKYKNDWFFKTNHEKGIQNLIKMEERNIIYQLALDRDFIMGDEQFKSFESREAREAALAKLHNPNSL